MSYFYLALAIAAEVAGTSLLKATEEFTKLVPTTFLVIFYLLSFWLMTLALRDLPLGVVYAVWSGLGICLVAVIGAVIYKDCLLYTSPSPRDQRGSRMPSSA